jgi:tyrosine kinase 2
VIEADAKNLDSIPRTRKVIVKRLRENATDQDQIKFLNECRVYRESPEHPNILNLIGFSVETMPFLVMLEYFPLGDLKSYLIAMKKCGEDSRLYREGVIIRMALGE